LDKWDLGAILPLTEKQKEYVKNILRTKLHEKIKDFAEQEDMNKPFYFALFSKEIVFVASLLQSIYTWLGGQWEEIASIVASDNFQRVEKRYQLKGEITSKEQAKIDNLLKDMEHGTRDINIETIKNELSDSFNNDDPRRQTSEIVDLFLEAGNKEFYFELKSVKPNKNEMRAAKQDLLNIVAMRQKVKDKQNLHVFLAMPFNSYFTGRYRRWTVTKFFKEGEDLLVGKDFWDLIGGKGTYEELLDVFEEVGKEAMILINNTIKSWKPSKTLTDFA